MPANAAAGRLFRTYDRYCAGPGPDTIFEFLTAMHSLNDRLKNSAGCDFHRIQEFVALKAIRNFAHHQEEVRANVKLVPSPAFSDLMVLCVVRRDQVERAIDLTDKRWRSATRAACERHFHWYGVAVNINPCLFNFVVRAYELMREIGIAIPREDVASFENAYESEVEHGQAHLVKGHLSMPAAMAESVLSAIAADLPSAS